MNFQYRCILTTVYLYQCINLKLPINSLSLEIQMLQIIYCYLTVMMRSNIMLYILYTQ